MVRRTLKILQHLLEYQHFWNHEELGSAFTKIKRSINAMGERCLISKSRKSRFRSFGSNDQDGKRYF